MPKSQAKNRRARRHYRPPSSPQLLKVVLDCFDIKLKDLGQIRSYQLKRFERYLKEGRHGKEEKQLLFLALSKAENHLDKSNVWPRFLSHYLYWFVMLYEAVLWKLPNSNKISEPSFKTFSVFNLAAPLLASADSRFGTDEPESVLGKGRKGLKLLGVNSSWIPSSSKTKDFPFSRVLRQLKKAGCFHQIRKDKGGYRNDLKSWIDGQTPMSFERLDGAMRCALADTQSIIQVQWEKSLEDKTKGLEFLREELIAQGQGEQHVDAEMKKLHDEIEFMKVRFDTEGVCFGVVRYLRFLMAAQQLLLRAKLWLGAKEFKTFLVDLNYWKEIPHNMRGIHCDGTWLEQPRTLQVDGKALTVSDHVWHEPKKYLDWLARYGSLRSQDIDELAELVCHKLVGKQQPT